MYKATGFKKFIALLLVASLFTALFLLSACGGGETEAQIKALQQENEELKKENSELEAKLKEAEPWFALSDMEKEAEKERLAQQKAQEEEAERLAAEQAAAQAAEKEKIGYDTGITYDQLSRTPDDYIGEKVKFYGHVIQVMEGTDETQLRLATNGNYDDVLLVAYSSDIVSSRVLEDDYITVYGISMGLYTYTSTMGGEITIPLVFVEKIDQ